MADYWVSRDKYFCKYCKIYIADDKPSRLHHETGLRHKGNYERYIRDVYRKGMTEQKDRAEEAREVARVEAAAAAAMGLDPAPASASTSDATNSSSAGARPRPPATTSTSTAASDPYANYSTAASLGYRDEAAERAEAARREAELRQTEGRIGQWETVTPAGPTRRAAGAAAGRGAQEEGFVGPARLGPGSQVGTVVGGNHSGPKTEEEEEEKKPIGATEGSEDESTSTGRRPRRGFLTEKSALADDDDEAAAVLAMPIKLKKRRLTVKEQQQAAQEEEEAARPRREEVEVRTRAEAEAAAAERARPRGKGTWEQVEVTEEPMLEFADPVEEGDAREGPPMQELQDGGHGTGGSGKKAGDEDEKKPALGGGAFKKRKIPGAASRRK